MVYSSEQRVSYWDDTYRYEVRSDVFSAHGGEAAVRENIVHPRGGGQPADIASVNGAAVTVRRDPETGVVWLNGESTAQMSIGNEVVLTIDAAARRLHAAAHSAGHLIEGVASRDGLKVVGLSHVPGECRLELEGPIPVDLDAFADRLRAGVEESIAAAIPFTAHIEDGFRTVTITGLHTVPCGGTHVTDTGCLDDVQLFDVKVKKGKVRLRYEASHREGRP